MPDRSPYYGRRSTDIRDEPPFLPGSRLRYMLAVAKRVFWLGDTIAIRTLMASASIVFAVLLLIYPDTFQRQSFSGMALVVTQFEAGRWIGPSGFWAALFLLHGCGVFWRIWERAERIRWAVAINWLGVFIWSAEFTLTNLSIGEFAAGNALELPAVVALFVALIRTGLNDEKVTP